MTKRQVRWSLAVGLSALLSSFLVLLATNRLLPECFSTRAGFICRLMEVFSGTLLAIGSLLIIFLVILPILLTFGWPPLRRRPKEMMLPEDTIALFEALIIDRDNENE